MVKCSSRHTLGNAQSSGLSESTDTHTYSHNTINGEDKGNKTHYSDLRNLPPSYSPEYQVMTKHFPSLSPCEELDRLFKGPTDGLSFLGSEKLKIEQDPQNFDDLPHASGFIMDIAEHNAQASEEVSSHYPSELQGFGHQWESADDEAVARPSMTHVNLPKPINSSRFSVSMSASAAVDCPREGLNASVMGADLVSHHWKNKDLQASAVQCRFFEAINRESNVEVGAKTCNKELQILRDKLRLMEDEECRVDEGLKANLEVLKKERDAIMKENCILLDQDCSSGACERNWSSYSLIHTEIRNRLKTTQLEKLVYCRANLRLLQKLKTLAGPMQLARRDEQVALQMTEIERLESSLEHEKASSASQMDKKNKGLEKMYHKLEMEDRGQSFLEKGKKLDLHPFMGLSDIVLSRLLRFLVDHLQNPRNWIRTDARHFRLRIPGQKLKCGVKRVGQKYKGRRGLLYNAYPTKVNINPRDEKREFMKGSTSSDKSSRDLLSYVTWKWRWAAAASMKLKSLLTEEDSNKRALTKGPSRSRLCFLSPSQKKFKCSMQRVEKVEPRKKGKEPLSISHQKLMLMFLSLWEESRKVIKLEREVSLEEEHSRKWALALDRVLESSRRKRCLEKSFFAWLLHFLRIQRDKLEHFLGYKMSMSLQKNLRQEGPLPHLQSTINHSLHANFDDCKGQNEKCRRKSEEGQNVISSQKINTKAVKFISAMNSTLHSPLMKRTRDLESTCFQGGGNGSAQQTTPNTSRESMHRMSWDLAQSLVNVQQQILAFANTLKPSLTPLMQSNLHLNSKNKIKRDANFQKILLKGNKQSEGKLNEKEKIEEKKTSQDSRIVKEKPCGNGGLSEVKNVLKKHNTCPRKKNG